MSPCSGVRALWLIVFLVAGPALADTSYVVLGTQHGGNYIPWWNYAGSMRWQTLFLQREIGRAGRIGSFGFRSYDGTSCGFSDVAVKMCLTPETTLKENFSSNYGGNAPATVFDTSFLQVGTGANSWFTIPAGFDYNNRDNLLVEVTWHGASGTGAYMWTANLTPGNRRVFAYDHAAEVGAPDWISCHARLGLVGGDVGCTRLLAPTGTLDSGARVVPACSTGNFGSTAESYAVRLKIGADYSETVLATAHAPGTRRYLTFPEWQARSSGLSAVICSTELAGDIDCRNDARRDSVRVTPPQSIAEPGGRLLVPGPKLNLLPNPLSGTIVIEYSLPAAGSVRLRLLDVAGRPAVTIVAAPRPAGHHTAELRTSPLSRGVYLLELETGAAELRKSVVTCKLAVR